MKRQWQIKPVQLAKVFQYSLLHKTKHVLAKYNLILQRPISYFTVETLRLFFFHFFFSNLFVQWVVWGKYLGYVSFFSFCLKKNNKQKRKRGRYICMRKKVFLKKVGYR